VDVTPLAVQSGVLAILVTFAGTVINRLWTALQAKDAELARVNERTVTTIVPLTTEQNRLNAQIATLLEDLLREERDRNRGSR
jgi:hypothetical protein